MFIFLAAQEYPSSDQTGTTPTQKRQEMDYLFRKSSISCCSEIKFLEPRVSQFGAMKKTNIKNLCCSRIIKYFRAAQKSLLLFCAAHRNKQKYFDAFALLWDDTKRSNCPGRASFAKARYMKSFSIIFGIYIPQFLRTITIPTQKYAHIPQA
jgi:hypothetical protein